MSLWLCPFHGLYGGQVFCPTCGGTGSYATLDDEAPAPPMSQEERNSRWRRLLDATTVQFTKIKPIINPRRPRPMNITINIRSIKNGFIVSDGWQEGTIGYDREASEQFFDSRTALFGAVPGLVDAAITRAEQHEADRQRYVKGEDTEGLVAGLRRTHAGRPDYQDRMGSVTGVASEGTGTLQNEGGETLAEEPEAETLHSQQQPGYVIGEGFTGVGGTNNDEDEQPL